MHLSKACHENGYDKINKLANFKCSLLSFFNKLRDAANELGSKKKKKNRGPGTPTIMGTLRYNSTICSFSLQCLKVTLKDFK